MDTTTVGVDLAKNVFVACVADCAGRIVARQEFNRAGFMTWLGTLPAGTVIGMEACGSAHHWGRTAQRLGLAPRLMAAEFVRPYRKRQSVKNDRADAEAMAASLPRGSASHPASRVAAARRSLDASPGEATTTCEPCLCRARAACWLRRSENSGVHPLKS